MSYSVARPSPRVPGRQAAGAARARAPLALLGESPRALSRGASRVCARMSGSGAMGPAAELQFKKKLKKIGPPSSARHTTGSAPSLQRHCPGLARGRGERTEGVAPGCRNAAGLRAFRRRRRRHAISAAAHCRARGTLLLRRWRHQTALRWRHQVTARRPAGPSDAVWRKSTAARGRRDYCLARGVIYSVRTGGPPRAEAAGFVEQRYARSGGRRAPHQLFARPGRGRPADRAGR